MNANYPSAQWPPQGSEMASVIRDVDWDQNPLGAVSNWPSSLRTSVTTVLDSPFPMIVLWGPGLIQLYNDAYRHILGERHPVAMGQKTQACWPEVWDFNEGIYQRVLDSGERVHLEDQAFVIEPSGVRETRYFTITYAPARDETGVVRGVFVVAMETTRRVLAERQNAAMLRETRFAADQLRTMFDQTPSFIALLKGPDHVFEIANAAYMRLTGRQDIIGKSVADAVPEIRSQGFLTLLDDAYSTGEPFLAAAMPIRLRNAADGAEVEQFLDFVYQPVRDVHGKVCGIFVEGSDVTAQHHAHLEGERLHDELNDKLQRLEKAERWQKFQLDLADRLRPGAPAEDVAAAACELLGQHLRAARVVFCEVDDANGTFIVRCEWMRSGMATVTGEVRSLDDFGADNIAILRAGNVFACDDTATDVRTAEHAAAYARVNIHSSLAIPLVKSGKFTIILNVHQAEPYHWSDEDIELARDTAERAWSAAESARAQAELREERDQSQYIFDNMIEGFGMIDHDWRVVHMNAEGLRLGQRTAEEVIGQNHWEIWPEVLGSEVEAVYRRVRASGKSETFEQFVPLSADSQTWLEVRVHRSLGGELAVFYNNITDRKAVEYTLSEVSRQKDEFLAMLAHELRNPLAPICAAAELLTVAPLDQGRVRQIGGVIKRQAAHMTSLIQDLLDVSRVTQGLVTLDLVAVDMKSIVIDAVEQVRPLLEAHGHRFSVQLSPEAIWVHGDKDRLVQVLANLLGNAAKYTPDGGHIDLCLDASQSRIMLSVIDNGIGMSLSLVERAFDLFAQAERTSDRIQGGLGIGLSLVKSLVELHGGTVAAYSAGDNAGSKFTVALPRLHKDETTVPGIATLTAVTTMNALRIMLVDDNVDASNMLAMVLEAAGHKVLVEHSSVNALQQARVAPPEVFLLDLGLPEIDGNELARRLALLPHMKNATFVAVTGYGQIHDKENAYRAGFHHHFTKPVDSNKLTALLAQIARSR